MSDTNTAPDLKLHVGIKRDMFHRNTGTYRAQLGDTEWAADAPTKSGAIALLHHELSNARRYEQTRHYRRTPGATWSLYYASGGWQYDIVHDDGPLQPSSCMMCCGEREALQRMESHIAQWAERSPAAVAA